jgi:hypothetical protein
MLKDAIKNIDVRRDDKPKVDLYQTYPYMKDRVPVGTTTYIFKTGKLAADGKLDRNNIVVKPNSKNPTDHISYEPPKATRPQQKVYDYMMTEPRYSKNHQSTVHWAPRD